MGNFRTYFNLPSLSNLGPIVRRNSGPPFKFNRNCTWGLLFRSPKASNIITRLNRRERKLSRIHMICIMIRVSTRRTHLIRTSITSYYSSKQIPESTKKQTKFQKREIDQFENTNAGKNLRNETTPPYHVWIKVVSYRIRNFKRRTEFP